MAPTVLPSPPNKMDAATRSAVIDVLRQDAADGIQGSAAARDQDMALRFWQEEINNYSTTAEDYRMAMSAARAIHSDRDVMAAAAEEEARAADDRRMAVQLAGEGHGRRRLRDITLIKGNGLRHPPFGSTSVASSV